LRALCADAVMFPALGLVVMMPVFVMT
jgi:hypothetical protein